MATLIPENRAAFSLEEIAKACSGELSNADWASIQTTSVETDSRRVREGALFVPLRGERFDAHAFLQQVQSANAAATLAEPGAKVPESLPVVRVQDTLKALGDLAAYHRRRWGGRVIAITGSAGKTTTKDLTYAALAELHKEESTQVARTAGNLNNLIGVPMTLLALTASHFIAVIEMGTNSPGEIARLASIAAPEVGVVTSVAIAHAEGLGSLEGVAREKAELLRALPPLGTAIYNMDSAALVEQVSDLACHKLTFGTSAGADLILDSQRIIVTSDELLVSNNRYKLTKDNSTIEIPMAMLGTGPAVDAAAALAVVVTLHGNQAVAQAGRAIAKVQPTPGRMCPIHGTQDTLVLDDSYNANPASMEASLKSCAEVARSKKGRAFAVLGAMKELGAHTRSAHVELGRRCGQLGFKGLIGYGDAMTDAVDAAKAANVSHASLVNSHERAADLIAQWIQPGDVILIKGSRSMAMERVVDALRREVEVA